MKIGLQVAMVPELHAIPGAKDLAPFETVSGVPFFEVEEGIIACAGGMGKVNAAMSAEILCRRFGVDLVINSGLAGCFTDLPTGTLLVADDFVQHDVDSSPLGDPVGMVSTVNCTYFPTWRPDHVAAVLKGLGVDVSRGRVATGDQFIQNGGSATRSIPSSRRWRAARSRRCACATACRSSRSNPSPTTSSARGRWRNTSITARRSRASAGRFCRWRRR